MNRLLFFALVVLVCLVSCGKDSVTDSGDAIPPATITDLLVQRAGQEFRLRWTAPGDDGPNGRAARYDIRYAAANLGAGWSTAAQVSSPPTPGNAGQTDSIAVSGIGWGPWQFGVKAVDEAGNWAILSNVVTTAPADTVAPGAVTDLAIDLLTLDSVFLRWTAPGEVEGTGIATQYDLRYSATPITPDSWASAVSVGGLAAPRPRGEVESCTVGNLERRTSYIFALRTSDENGNWSGLSNLASVWIRDPLQITTTSQRYHFFGTDNPDWSRDNNRIAFDMGDPEQIFVIPASGGTAAAFTSGTPGKINPSWSPDGDRLAFLTRMNNGLAPTLQVLSVMASQPGASAEVLADHRPASVRDPRWSPDGSKILYCVVGSDPSPIGLHVIPTTGGATDQLYGGWNVAGADWSLDGSRIVYASKESGNYDIWTMSATGEDRKQLTSTARNETNPRWRPDGEYIAYYADQAIWALRPWASTGDTPIKLINEVYSAVPNGAFAWSANSGSIAYVGIKDQDQNLWVQRVK